MPTNKVLNICLNGDFTSAVGWTLSSGLPQGFDFRNLEGEVIYFTGIEAATIEISWITGLGC